MQIFAYRVEFHLVGCCLCGILKIFGDSKQHRSPWRQLVYWVSWEYQTQAGFTFEHQKHVICAFKKNRSSLHKHLVWLIPSVPWSRILMNECTETGAFWRWQHVITSITKTLPSNQFDDWNCRLWRTEKEMLREKSNINIGNFQLRGNLTQSNICNNDYVQAPSNSLLWIRAEVKAPEDPLLHPTMWHWWGSVDPCLAETPRSDVNWLKIYWSDHLFNLKNVEVAKKAWQHFDRPTSGNISFLTQGTRFLPLSICLNSYIYI